MLGISYYDLQTKSSEDIKSLFLDLIESSRSAEHKLHNSFIHAYTYHPLMGITSEIRPNGKIITCHYDGFGRLITIRDHIGNGDGNGNVIKHFEYHYQEEVEE